MRITIIIFSLIAVMGLQKLQAQTTYIPSWAKENWLLDRMEIKATTNNSLNLSTVKPYMRKAYVEIGDSVRALLMNGQNPWALSKVDQYNLDRFEANNSEFSVYDTASMPQWKSRKPFLGFMWPTKGNMLEVNTKDFYLSVNPAINQQQSIESDFDERVFVNSKGVIARGLIDKKIGFHFMLTDNQEQGPLQFRQNVDSNDVVHGTGFWKEFKDNGVDYYDARGSVNWNITSHINMQFGFDNHFIGNGYRSLFISNYVDPSVFLKFNTRWKKLNYTNLFFEMMAERQPRGDVLIQKKYVAMHHLSYNVLPWLNVGLFEAMVFGQPNKFKANYIQPVILMNSLLGQKDGENNGNIGFDVKANFLKHFQVYGQVMLDGIEKVDDKGGSNSWSKRSAVQLGGKYVDAFGIRNLDLQAEFNQIRPFTYSGNDSTNAYTHYNQPLAHPLGGNVREIIAVLRYQPINRLYIYARGIFWQQGLDSAGYNFGANPTKINTSVNNGGMRLYNDGYTMFSGIGSKGVNGAITLSYEVKENLFIDANAMYRVFDKDDSPRQTTSVMTLGLRWNMFRRDYDY